MVDKSKILAIQNSMILDSGSYEPIIEAMASIQKSILGVER